MTTTYWNCRTCGEDFTGSAVWKSSEDGPHCMACIAIEHNLSSAAAIPKDQLRVVRAAIRDPFGGIHSVPPPGRHNDVIKQMVEAGISPPIGPSKYEQGFLLNNGQFCRRKPAARVAIVAGQCTTVQLPGIGLLSEDVW